MRSKRPLAALGLFTALLAFTSACRKENDPCSAGSAPVINDGAWPSGLSHDSTYVVHSNHVLMMFSVNPTNRVPFRAEGLYLRSLSVRLTSDLNDSLLFAQDIALNTSDPYTYIRTVGPDSLIDDLPATLRFSATNSCGGTSEVVRHLLFVPN